MKIKQIDTLEAKTRLSELLVEVQRGQRFHITKHGKPIAELAPLPSSPKRPRAGFARGAFSYVALDFDAPLEEFRVYMKRGFWSIPTPDLVCRSNMGTRLV